MPFLLRFLRRAVALAVTCCATLATPSHAAAPAPVASFFDNPAFSGAKLSPDARLLAVRMAGAGQRERLAVVDLADLSVKVVATFSDTDVGYFEWVNNERLVFDTDDRQSAPGDMAYGPGLYAVNRDGGKFLQLASRSGSTPAQMTGKLLPWHTFLPHQKGSQDSDYVYVLSPHNGDLRAPEYVSLLRLNTLNGRSYPVERPAATRQWLLDNSGEPRLAISNDHNVQQIHYRDPADGKWRKLAEFDSYRRGPGSFWPQSFGPDGTLYVRAQSGGDTIAIYPYDLKNQRIAATPLVTLDGYDYSGELISDNTALLGARYLSDARSTVWFSARMQAAQAAVDALLPATVNLISVAPRASAPNVLVLAYSDSQPEVYLLFNTETGKLTKIGDTRPAIDAAVMATKELVHYKARDGLTIPAWLTIPHGSTRKNLPLVVLVHGGPYLRGTSWQWSAQTQFLASRGYAVLEPEYRGSTGFGAKHFKAGWKQWGLKMQDDIADGARWAISQGIVDAKRICIAGASYGGYATLMGLVNDPDLYRCGVEWAGVTDIQLMYDGHWTLSSDLSDDWKQYGMPELIGDPHKDAAQFYATSPLRQAARIKQPLLLAYGDADKRVPLYHGSQFHDAVSATNPDVEWIVYPQEGHGWSLPKNRIDFWSRVEKFLGRNIGTSIGPSIGPVTF